MVQGLKGGYQSFDDNFFQRQVFIQDFNRLKLALGDRIFPTVLVNRDGWMVFLEDTNINDFQNSTGFTKKDADEVVEVISQCYRRAQEDGFTFLIVVAPNKETIYPNIVPDQIGKTSKVSRFDVLNTELLNRSLPGMLDLRGPLIRESAKRQIYYKTDTHWNGYGAYIAYEEIIKALAQDYPVLVPYPEKFFRIKERSLRVRDMAESIGTKYIMEPLIGPSPEFINFTTFGVESGQKGVVAFTPDKDLPSLLMLHDSFGQTLIPFLSNNFEQAIYSNVSTASVIYIDKDKLSYINPDIVILEIVERNLPFIAKYLEGC
ncbi:MAG TPA: hypothetical protein PLT08_09945 [Anaerolineales bacterium]|nr:hypothetical protein [Anaerolineales bacterium]